MHVLQRPIESALQQRTEIFRPPMSEKRSDRSCPNNLLRFRIGRVIGHWQPIPTSPPRLPLSSNLHSAVVDFYQALG